MPSRTLRRLLTAFSLLLLVGCTVPDPAATARLEKPDITIGVMPIPDVAGLYLAKRAGIFTREGFRSVQLEMVQGAALAIPVMLSGRMDASIINYVTAVTSVAQKTADLRFLCDAYQATSKTFMVMVRPDSPIKSVADLKGKTIAVPTTHSIATLTTTEILRVNGLKQDDVSWVEIPLPNMSAALRSGSIDGAWMTEPFISAAGIKDGAVALADTAAGPTADFPIAGWGTTARWVQDNPRTAAALRRVLEEGQRLAADRKAVTNILPTYTAISPADAQIITLGTYPRSLRPERVQRVPDLMQEMGYLPDPFDIAPLLLSSSTSSQETS
ncbi:ABC transporter substrate-binding protein [Streptosporangium sp. NPDC020072]|uniref:ABC transporter substrate-binding protein n=1 Tax=Streptosporangium sp. NPDC020072 TaxID=3154788 RepID=UPI0034300759